MKKNLLPFLFFFCFTSCNDNNNRILDCFKNVDVTDVVKETDVAKITTSNSKTIRIYIEERILKTSDLFDSVEYVQLSNDPNAVIGGINKLIVFDNSFFVHDKWKTKSVRRFGLDGSYIATIGNRGQGPKEYIDATDFTIQDSMVLLYDSYQDKINYYDLNGQYVKSKKVKYLFDTFHAINSDYLCLQTTHTNNHIPSIKDYNLLIVDTLFNIKHKTIYNKDLGSFEQTPFGTDNTNKNIVYYYRALSDTIYSINDRCEVTAEYKFIFDKPVLPLSFQSKNNKAKELNKVMNGDDYVSPMQYIMADDYVIIDYIFQPYRIVSFFSKKTDKIKNLYKNESFIHDISPFGLGKFLTADGNCIIGFTHPCDLLGKGSFDKEQNNNPKLRAFINNMSKDDNPFLIISHIKDF